MADRRVPDKMPIRALLFATAAWLSYANGANDNPKGVATLLGSGTASYGRALRWGTMATLLGSLAALFMATKLLSAFSGNGIVPEALVGAPTFLLSAGLAAAAVIMGASTVGLPLSTTHALTGALTGAGLAAAGAQGIAWQRLGVVFGLPLLASPLLAAGGVALLYPFLHRVRLRAGIREDTCICVDRLYEETVPAATGVLSLGRAATSRPVGITIDHAEICGRRYDGRWFGVRTRPLLDGLHYASGAAVSFAPVSSPGSSTVS